MIVVYSTANGQQLPRIDKMMPWTFETSFPKEGATSAGTSGMEKFTTKKTVVVKQHV